MKGCSCKISIYFPDSCSLSWVFPLCYWRPFGMRFAALRPPSSTAPNADVVDETFWQWQMPVVQRALNQVRIDMIPFLFALPFCVVMHMMWFNFMNQLISGNSSNFLLQTFLNLYHQSILENLNLWRVSLTKCCPKMPISIVVRATFYLFECSLFDTGAAISVILILWFYKNGPGGGYGNSTFISTTSWCLCWIPFRIFSSTCASLSYFAITEIFSFSDCFWVIL